MPTDGSFWSIEIQMEVNKHSGHLRLIYLLLVLVPGYGISGYGIAVYANISLEVATIVPFEDGLTDSEKNVVWGPIRGRFLGWNRKKLLFVLFNYWKLSKLYVL